jgi:hypothetical protein
MTMTDEQREYRDDLIRRGKIYGVSIHEPKEDDTKEVRRPSKEELEILQGKSHTIEIDIEELRFLPSIREAVQIAEVAKQVMADLNRMQSIEKYLKVSSEGTGIPLYNIAIIPHMVNNMQSELKKSNDRSSYSLNEFYNCIENSLKDYEFLSKYIEKTNYELSVTSELNLDEVNPWVKISCLLNYIEYDLSKYDKIKKLFDQMKPFIEEGVNEVEG